MLRSAKRKNLVRTTSKTSGKSRRAQPSNERLRSIVNMASSSSIPATSGVESALENINKKLEKLDKLDSIESSVAKIAAEVHVLEGRVTELEKDQRELERNVSYQSEDIDELRRDLRNGHDEVTADLESRLLQVENDIRRRNIIMIGVPEGEENGTGGCRDFFKHFITDVMHLTVGDSVVHAFRLGPRRGEARRPILVKMETQVARDSVLAAAPRTLKEKPFKGINIVLTDDAPPEIRQQRRKLLPKLAELRKEQKPAFIPWDRPPCIRYKNTPEGPWKVIRASDYN